MKRLILLGLLTVISSCGKWRGIGDSGPIGGASNVTLNASAWRTSELESLAKRDKSETLFMKVVWSNWDKTVDTFSFGTDPDKKRWADIDESTRKQIEEFRKSHTALSEGGGFGTAHVINYDTNHPSCTWWFGSMQNWDQPPVTNKDGFVSLDSTTVFDVSLSSTNSIGEFTYTDNLLLKVRGGTWIIETNLLNGELEIYLRPPQKETGHQAKIWK